MKISSFTESFLTSEKFFYISKVDVIGGEKNQFHSFHFLKISHTFYGDEWLFKSVSFLC